MSLQLPVVLLLGFSVFASAVGVVYIKHQSRTMFVSLQELEREQDEMQVEWGQWELELSTWASHDRIAKVATEQLQLFMPPGDAVILVTP